MSNFKNLTGQVESTLIQYPETRNDDALLVQNIYNDYYHWYDKKILDDKRIYDTLKYAPGNELVRIRQKFNQNLKYLPTDQEVFRLRKLKIEKVKEELGYCAMHNLTSQHYIELAELAKRYDNQILK